jgi:hypothetical protein
MANILDAIKELAAKAGLSNNQELDLALAGSAADTLRAFEIPDSAMSAFRENLMDMQQAKAKLDLKNHFIGDYMKGYDESVVDLAKESGLALETIAEIKSAKNSGDKVKLAFRAMKALEEDARKSGKGGNSDEFVRKIAEKQKELEDYKQLSESEKNQIQHKYVSKMESLWKQSHLSGISWNDALPEIARVPAYEAGLNAKLSSLGGKLIFDPETQSAKVVNAQDSSLPLMNGSKEFAFSDLHSLVLQENKLLKDSNGGGTPVIPSGTQFIPPSGGQGTQKISPSMASALADISRTAAQMQNPS